MKKMNKGFSLVELIIVIAIMAILAGAIAPALIRYIDKSRKSNDVSSAKTIKTAIETAMSNEDTYEMLTTCSTASSVTDAEGNTVQFAGSVVVAPGLANTATGAVTCNFNAAYTPANTSIKTDAEAEIAKNVGEKMPKVKYKKDAKEAATGTSYISGSSCDWYGYCSQGGSVIVGLGNGTNFYQLAPELSKYYQ